MPTRDEVLAEFTRGRVTKWHSTHDMADEIVRLRERVRELEAASEPVACKKCGGSGYAIDSERSIGSAVVGKKCDCGAVAYITNGDTPHPSVSPHGGDRGPADLAAGVSEARINEMLDDLDDAVCARENAWHDLASRSEREAAWQRYKDARAAIETVLAALTAASEGASA